MPWVSIHLPLGRGETVAGAEKVFARRWVEAKMDALAGRAQALPGDPNISAGVPWRPAGSTSDPGALENSHCCRRVFHSPPTRPPDVEIRLGRLGGPKHPRAALAVDRYGWAIEVGPPGCGLMGIGSLHDPFE